MYVSKELRQIDIRNFCALFFQMEVANKADLNVRLAKTHGLFTILLEPKVVDAESTKELTESFGTGLLQ